MDSIPKGAFVLPSDAFLYPIHPAFLFENENHRRRNLGVNAEMRNWVFTNIEGRTIT